MDERLIVKNFLCLKDIDIEVKDFLVLIGPQAAGKSLCAKLLYFFRTIIEEIIFYRIRCSFGESPDFDTILSNKFESFFPKSYWAEQEFCIEYYREKQKIFSITKGKHQELNLYCDKEILTLFEEAVQGTCKLFCVNGTS